MNIVYKPTDNLISKIENTIYSYGYTPSDVEQVYEVHIDTVGYGRLCYEITQKTAGLPVYNEKKELVTNNDTISFYVIPFLGKIEIYEDEELNNSMTIKKVK